MNRLSLLLYHETRRFSISICVGKVGGRRNFALTSTTPRMGALPNQRKIALVTFFRGVLNFEGS
jgi:hypothetical protein